MKKIKLDREEAELTEAFDRGELKTVRNARSKIKKHVEYAKATTRKDKRVNIRISQKDLETIQRKAMEEGIPYQTLISSLLHKYINGRLVEKKV